MEALITYWVLFMGLQLLYSSVLVSVVQSASAICIHISLLLWINVLLKKIR